MPEDTTIRIKESTKRQLYDLKDMGESYDEVINRLLDDTDSESNPEVADA